MTESFVPLVHDGWAVLSAGNKSSDDATVPTWSAGVDCGVGPARLALGDAGERRLLIPVSEALPVPVDVAGAGLNIQESRLQIDNMWIRFIDISCDDRRLFAVFSTIVGEILERLSDGVSPVNAVAGAINDFRELLRRTGQSLTREVLTGLAGELYLLKDLVAIDPSAVATWVGPGGGRHDFMGRQISVEVKSSLRAVGKLVHISSIDQLDCAEGEELYLSWFQFEESGQGGRSITDLIRAILEMPVDEAQISGRLKFLGLEDWRQNERLASFRVRLLASEIYCVKDTFPRISTESFVGNDLPDGVVACQYTIDLNQAAAFLVDSDKSVTIKDKLAKCPTP